MKRFLIIPLLFLYLVAVSGVRMQVHYCGKQVVSWSLYGDAPGCDGRSEKKKAHKCCSDKEIQSRVHADHQVAVVKFLPDNILYLAPDPIIVRTDPEVSTIVSSRSAGVYRANAPPGRWQDLALHKLHMQFTYYG